MSDKKQKLPVFKKGLIKGRSTAVLVSIGIHAALIIGAGTFVVFTVIQQKEAKFVPPEKLNRPKMKLKKLRVKVKQSSKPKRSTSRISTKTTSVMPDIQLPEMTGLGGGLSEGIGGFQMIADIGEMSLMGGDQSIGNDLEGTFYDLKRFRNDTLNPNFGQQTGEKDKIQALLKEYMENDWSASVFNEFWRSPKKLYATQFMVPPCTSSIGPSKFGITDPEFIANNWVAVYKGQIGHPKGGRFRLWGVADDILVVRINGEFVLDASWGSDKYHTKPGFHIELEDNKDVHRKFQLGAKTARVGNWFTLEPGVPVQMDLLVSEIPGGTFMMMVLVEEEGVEYEENEYGAPIVHMFKTMEPPSHLVDEITYQTVPDRFEIEGGPVFGTY